MNTLPVPARGEVWLINLNSEDKQGRPCLVIQNDAGNDHAPTTIVAPISTLPTDSPVVIKVNTASKTRPFYINFALLRCIHKSRLLKKLGRVDQATLEGVNRAIRKSLAV